jgi:CRISPR-associated protein Cas1
MQLHINTYGTYVHIKDELFEIRLKDEQGQVQKRHLLLPRSKASL